MVRLVPVTSIAKECHDFSHHFSLKFCFVLPKKILAWTCQIENMQNKNPSMLLRFIFAQNHIWYMYQSFSHFGTWYDIKQHETCWKSIYTSKAWLNVLKPLKCTEVMNLGQNLAKNKSYLEIVKIWCQVITTLGLIQVRLYLSPYRIVDLGDLDSYRAIKIQPYHSHTVYGQWDSHHFEVSWE